ncbi:HAD-IC family P-type ATPase [Phormidesmis priestleyi]
MADKLTAIAVVPSYKNDMTSQTVSPVSSPMWHHLSASQLTQMLGSNLQRGLTIQEVLDRQKKHGANELTGKKSKPGWLKFILQFNQPLIIILVAAGIIKALIGEWLNASVIWGVTTTNATISYLQEAKAEGAIAALAHAMTTEATVIRDGKKLRISSKELVPGDLVLLTSGDKVPADLRLVKVRDLQIDESALTGESVAIAKEAEENGEPPILEVETPLAERGNMAYAGGFVTFGQGTGLVTAIGNETETGKISQLLEQRVDLTTPLTRKFNQFSQNWLFFVLGMATLTFAVGLGQRSFNDAIEAAVALVVGAIPEGLPAVITVTLAVGVSRMAKRHAIIRKLPAVETLGGATVICSDKTGTLTENQMTVQQIYVDGESYTVTGGGYSPDGEILLRDEGGGMKDETLPLPLRDCLIAGVVCNDSHLEREAARWMVVGDPTEGALITSGSKAGLDQADLLRSLPRLDSIPFESQFQYMATLHQSRGENLLYAKGSVESMLSRCQVALGVEGQTVELDRPLIEQQVDTMAKQGLRVLAFAKKHVSDRQTTVDHSDLETGLVFLGLQGMIDPPRPEAIAAVHACQSAGIQVKMITGDHIGTATAIARRMGFRKDRKVKAFTGSDLAAMNPSELANAVEEGVVFARVAPEQKLRLVEALQFRGQVVAMTGDGVNDAPALKQADIGIAMGSGTEVSKEAADMLLTDDNFASIEAAVEEGRSVYKNLIKAICFILPVNGGESMTILISTLLGRELPILSLQILWLNMLNSITMTVPLSFEPKSSGVMKQPPRPVNEPFLTPNRIKRILAVSLYNWTLIFGIFEWVRQAPWGSIELARTMAIQALVMGRIFYLLSISQLVPSLIAKWSGAKEKVSGAPALAVGIGLAIVLQIIFSNSTFINQIFKTAPMSLDQWLVCFGASLPMIAIAYYVNRFDPPN